MTTCKGKFTQKALSPAHKIMSKPPITADQAYHDYSDDDHQTPGPKMPSMLRRWHETESQQQ
ncbi:uncharacterized protein N7487_011063 [Penicillium crustosum]|uniref:uncharacterized protein n=1 Tax=Penicillium crustosum TaxID=36656 RepID=UPI00239DE581|nr:uncharacterized protein N7487_011063 [Penicillium crustosum]KAJ5393422.1 hypothetical protein N7487_011063 [Penicillium crustosum]